jgi:hypothetical protein
MADINLTQAEAIELINMEKHRLDDTAWDYPTLGGSITIPLIAANRKESFLLDISRSRINLAKGTYQNRGRKIVVLVRLDFGGPPHRNPDDAEIPTPHLHIYREGYGDKWAFPISSEEFSDIANLSQTLEDFMRYCNITERPSIRRGLWS